MMFSLLLIEAFALVAIVIVMEVATTETMQIASELSELLCVILCHR
jgi:hypothetical protein